MTYDNDSYQRQNQLLEHLRSQLDALNQYVDTSRENYRNQIRASANQGFMTDYTDKLEGKFVVFSSLIDKLQDSIGRSKNMIDNHEHHLDDLRRQSSVE